MNTPTEDRVFEGAAGTHLFFRAAVPETPRAVIVIVHGFGEHSGRYAPTVARLADAGYAVYVMDLRGFGRNTRIPANIRSIEQIVEDLHLLTALARRENPGRRVVLLGHSMGGLLALNQLLEHPDQYDYCITSGPGLLPPANTSAFVIRVAGLLAKLIPLVPVSSMGTKKGTRNQELLRQDEEDPLFYDGGFRARTGYLLLKTQIRVVQELPRITTPLLALHGEGDLLISPDATEILYDRVGSADKKKVIFPVLYHELLNEPEREIVFQTIFDWLGERLPPR